MSEPFIGEVRLWAMPARVRGWEPCNGQLLPIAGNQALFSLIGTTYGGDGVQTFALPDLRGRTAIGQGQGPGLSPRRIGEIAGAETVTLRIAELPAHTHARTAVIAPATEVGPTGHQLAEPEAEAYGPAGAGRMAPTGDVGGGQPHENRPPTLALAWYIATEGVFPQRN